MLFSLEATWPNSQALQHQRTLALVTVVGNCVLLPTAIIIIEGFLQCANILDQKCLASPSLEHRAEILRLSARGIHIVCQPWRRSLIFFDKNNDVWFTLNASKQRLTGRCCSPATRTFWRRRAVNIHVIRNVHELITCSHLQLSTFKIQLPNHSTFSSALPSFPYTVFPHILTLPLQTA